MQNITELLDHVSDGSLVSGLEMAEADVAASLGARDTSEFSERWMDAFRRVEVAKAHTALSAASVDVVSKAREAAYLQAFKRWRSADLAAYISDDIGLIADAFLTNCTDSWLNELLDAYLRGQFPIGEFRK